MNLQSDLSTSLARIAVGLLLLIIWHRAFKGGKRFAKPVIILPALLFAVWNLFYNLSSGAVLGGTTVFVEAVITAIAPAIFEEVLFRGIFIYNLRKKGCGSMKRLIITAALFAVIHLTNLAGADTASVALQVGYSFVIGLSLAAVYLRNGSIMQVILIHFLIDLTNRIYAEPAKTASSAQLIIFAVLLAAEAVYAIWLCAGSRE